MKRPNAVAWFRWRALLAVHGGEFPWMVELEGKYEAIRDELRAGLDNPRLEALGNAVWVPAAREEALAYGPDWRTLVLQDRCAWEPTNVTLFPKTTAILKGAGAPSVEAFFARQAPATGRGLHSSTFRLNLSAFCKIGGAFRGCRGGVWEISGRVRGCFGCILCQERLRLS